MMRLLARPIPTANPLSDELDQKVANETPTVRAKITPSKEMYSDDESASELVRVCKACMESATEGEFCAKCGEPLVTIRRTPDLYLGEVIGGKYRIEQKIGQGGMGVVYLALNDELGQKVAVKFLSRKFADDESIVLRFLNEAKSYCRVSHPNAVTLLEYGQHHDATLYIITEFIDGKNVTETLKERGPLASEHVLDIGLQVAEVLSVAHRTGVIHRDLKPDNIMLIPSPRGRYAVKVLDFGIAKIVDDEHGPTTETGSVFGTPEFMSPEQARGDVADGRSDIYALGIILFYMLTGKLPFQGKNKLVVLNQQLNEDPPRPSSLVEGIEIPPKLESVIMKCLNKRPRARYATADDLLEALEELRVPGGQATGRVSKTDDPEVVLVRSETVRFGLDEASDFEGRADTLSARFDEPLVPVELDSIDLSREMGPGTGRQPQTSERAPILVGGVVVVVLAALIAIGGVMYSDADAPVASPVPDVAFSQASALISIASTTLEEGSLDAASEMLAQAAAWGDDELPDPMQEKRAALHVQLEDLRGIRADLDAAIAANECGRAKRLLAAAREKSPGLAQRMESQTSRCQAAKPTPAQAPRVVEDPPPQKPTVVAVPAPAPQEPVKVAPAEVVAPPAQAEPEPDPPAQQASQDDTPVKKKASDPEGVDAGEKVDELPNGMALPPRHID